MVLQWEGVGVGARWSKLADAEEAGAGYRYLRLVVTEDTGELPGGQLVVNEVEFYQGVLLRSPLPALYQKMKTPRYPPSLMVACSSYADQDTHCFKVITGNCSFI